MPKFKSKFEEEVFKELKKITKVEYEPDKIKFVQPAAPRTYTPDFKIGKSKYIETKGRLDLEGRKKLIWFKEQNPDVTILILFMDSRKTLTKRSKTSYGQWATDNGFTWADYRNGIPKEWFT